MPDGYEIALTIAQALLREKRPPTASDIADAIEGARRALVLGDDFDFGALQRDLETRSNIWIGRADHLDNSEGHIPWLSERRASIEWRYWHRYERLLEEVHHYAPATVGRLGQLTDEVLERLEDPLRTGAWDRRGLVVGQIQSGKTSNYAGLIAKAADAGYRMIIVLAGRTNSLRSQTQLRLDESFLGYDTRVFFNSYAEGEEARTRRVGVGLFGGIEQWPMCGTNSEELGDFNRGVAGRFGIVPSSGNAPLLLVVKKNVSVLKNMVTWATAIAGQDDPERGISVVRDVPLLVIDDEADDASVNTKPILDENGNVDPELDPTQTNRQIRLLLHSFEKVAYVGYTATPFANIFIHPSVEHDGLGPDLFPRHFVVNLPAPSNYIGPARVFGVATGSDGQIEARTGLPVLREISDSGAWVPDGHKKGLTPGDVPTSLAEAIRSFILSCAARMARGQNEAHNSMLVHVTRFTDVQRRIGDQVQDELTLLQRRLRHGDGTSSSNLRNDLYELWRTDFDPTTTAIREVEPDLSAELPQLTWRQVEPHLLESAERIRVKVINGSANDSLEYWNHPNGLSVIAIGGDKLSRGLTLEGLTVSYYLRGSRMYDTLMQMGRWFGYRDGYLDVCRLYTTRALADWYRHITLASEELRLEFQTMAERGMTPEDFGLRVLTHPSGLKITQAGKMRQTETVRVAFSGTLAESLVLHTEPEAVRENLRSVETLIAGLVAEQGTPPAPRGRGDFLWGDVPGSRIAAFLDDVRSHPASPTSDGRRLASFIRDQVARGELTSWSVLLVSSSSPPRRVTLGGINGIGLTRRTPDRRESAGFSLDRLLSPEHESADLTDDQFEAARTATRDRWKDKGRPGDGEVPARPAGTDARQARPPQKGLLILYPLDAPEGVEPYLVGYAVSFPASATARTVEYAVNEVYRVQQLELDL